MDLITQLVIYPKPPAGFAHCSCQKLRASEEILHLHKTGGFLGICPARCDGTAMKY